MCILENLSYTEILLVVKTLFEKCFFLKLCSLKKTFKKINFLHNEFRFLVKLS